MANHIYTPEPCMCGATDCPYCYPENFVNGKRVKDPCENCELDECENCANRKE